SFARDRGLLGPRHRRSAASARLGVRRCVGYGGISQWAAACQQCAHAHHISFPQGLSSAAAVGRGLGSHSSMIAVAALVAFFSSYDILPLTLSAPFNDLFVHARKNPDYSI